MSSYQSNDEAIEEKLTSGDDFKELIGIRDYLIHELVGNRCSTCQMSKLRTGDTAALTKQLREVLERITVLRKARALEEAQKAGKVVGLAAIRSERGGGRDAGGATPPAPAPSKLGTKNARRRTRTRRDSGA